MALRKRHFPKRRGKELTRIERFPLPEIFFGYVMKFNIHSKSENVGQKNFKNFKMPNMKRKGEVSPPEI